MSTAAQDLLKVFDSLAAAEQHEVAVEILRRTTSADDIPDAALDELAAELFRSYDAEESAHADPSAR
jgi:5-methylcytosine-specific restriction endonuclease McrBC regulatory subunit McrC